MMGKDTLVDAIDLKILESLQQNSRISFADIGRIIGLSPSAVRERVQKMEDQGVIKKYGIQLDYKLLGHDLEVFILVKVFHGNLQRFLDFVTTLSEIREAHRITGNYNVHLKVLLKDQLHLQSLIDQLMPYGDTHTFLILSQVSP